MGSYPHEPCTRAVGRLKFNEQLLNKKRMHFLWNRQFKLIFEISKQQPLIVKFIACPFLIKYVLD